MQISFVFLYILLCSEASAAGPLRRGNKYEPSTPRIVTIELTESRWRRQDSAKSFQNITAASTPNLVIVTTSGVASGAATESTADGTIPTFDFHPSSTVPIGSVDSTATSETQQPTTSATATDVGSSVANSGTIPTFDFHPSSTVPVGSVDPTATTTQTKIATTGAGNGTQPTATGASSSIPTFDFHPSSTVPVGPVDSTATEAATAPASNGTQTTATAIASSVGSSTSIPTFDFHPSSTVPVVGSSAVGGNQSATQTAIASNTSNSSATSAVDGSTIPTFDFFPSSTVSLDSSTDAAATTAVPATKPATGKTGSAKPTFTFSSVVKSSVVAQPSTATGKPDNQVPTVITSLPPTSTTAAPEVLKSNLAQARQYNDLFSKMNDQSACSVGQVACISGNVGKCTNAGVFDIIPCVDGLACYALPMNTTTGVQVGCYDNASAKQILSGGSAAAPTASSAAGSQVTVTEQPIETVTSQVTVTPGAPTETSVMAPTSAVAEPPTASVVTQTVDHTIGYTTTVSVTYTPTSSVVEVPTQDPTTLVTVTQSAPSSSITEEPTGETPSLVVIPITRTRHHGDDN